MSILCCVYSLFCCLQLANRWTDAALNNLTQSLSANFVIFWLHHHFPWCFFRHTFPPWLCNSIIHPSILMRSKTPVLFFLNEHRILAHWPNTWQREPYFKITLCGKFNDTSFSPPLAPLLLISSPVSLFPPSLLSTLTKLPSCLCRADRQPLISQSHAPLAGRGDRTR